MLCRQLDWCSRRGPRSACESWVEAGWGGPPMIESAELVRRRQSGRLITQEEASWFENGYTTGITVSANSIFSNVGLAHHLQAAGEPANAVTPNDPLDGDTVEPSAELSGITNVTYTSGLTIQSVVHSVLNRFRFSRSRYFATIPYSNFILGQGQFYGGAVDVSQMPLVLVNFNSRPRQLQQPTLCRQLRQTSLPVDTSEFSMAVPISKESSPPRITEFGARVPPEISFTPPPTRGMRRMERQLACGPMERCRGGRLVRRCGHGKCVTVSDTGRRERCRTPSYRFGSSESPHNSSLLLRGGLCLVAHFMSKTACYSRPRRPGVGMGKSLGRDSSTAKNGSIELIAPGLRLTKICFEGPEAQLTTRKCATCNLSRGMDSFSYCSSGGRR